jgi:hypothetical protein
VFSVRFILCSSGWWLSCIGNLKVHALILWRHCKKRRNDGWFILLELACICENIPESVKKLRLFSDGCVSQIKKHCSKLREALVDKKMVSIGWTVLSHYRIFYHWVWRDFALAERGSNKSALNLHHEKSCEMSVHIAARNTTQIVPREDVLNTSKAWKPIPEIK